MLLDAQWQIFARYLSLSKKPILCGPFRSEIGFECLYWIPFLNQFRLRYAIDRNRLIAIGRGGSAVWYDMAGTADLYEHVPVETVRQWGILASQQTGSLKQQRVEPWERHVCGLTAHALGIPKYHQISPSWMYGLLEPFWAGGASQRWLNGRIAPQMRMPPPPLKPELQAKLPTGYVAMRWYSRPTWPFKEDLLLWARGFTERIAKGRPVVIIDSFHADDHADLSVGPIPNVTRLSAIIAMSPLDNLAVQSAVIARADAYIGTYGGMSQLAMRFGVPTLALYKEFGQTAPEHLSLTQHLSLRTGVPFIACTPKQVDGVLPVLLGRA